MRGRSQHIKSCHQAWHILPPTQQVHVCLQAWVRSDGGLQHSVVSIHSCTGQHKMHVGQLRQQLRRRLNKAEMILLGIKPRHHTHQRGIRRQA